MNLFQALLASTIVSLISFVGVLTLLIKEKFLHKILLILVAFSAGSLIGDAFLHLIPERLEQGGDFANVFFWVIVGFTFFFILERYLHWRHCHDEHCQVHTFSYVSLFGDAAHNFIDGLIIGGSFFINPALGWITTLTILTHEIPQELGDFGILLYGGLSKAKALLFNFLSALTAVAGTLLGFVFAAYSEPFTGLLLPFTAGGFFYIAASDLIPELHEVKDKKQSLLTMLTFILGLAFMYGLTFLG
ncbi:zinc transporter [Candidatus Termititenax dinenymphae]|uniref:Zinc transporter n=1 Tax=Candidatus Termititenax dinenymphae TaxID=2218523 RepID=A0A388TJM3_9BACT|nr:zinc transporter [Candidatus Termititenax dinenymphae]